MGTARDCSVARAALSAFLLEADVVEPNSAVDEVVVQVDFGRGSVGWRSAG